MQGKVAIVTGASSGIGRATAALFAQKGASVIAVARNEKALNELRDGIKTKKGSIKIHLADVTGQSQIERMVSETIQNFGAIDVLVNAAGIIQNGSIENTTHDNWDKVMNVNLRSMFTLMKLCIPYLDQTKGNIVNE